MRWSLLVLALLAMVGCDQERQETVRTEKRIVTITRSVRDEIHGDQIVRLDTVTRTVTTEDGQSLGDTTIETKPPQFLGAVPGMIGKAATVLTGNPVVGAAAEKATDWLTTLIAGGTLATTTAGTGYVAMRRKRLMDEYQERAEEAERHRRQLIHGIEEARDVFAEHLDGDDADKAKDIDKAFCKTLATHQDEDLRKVVQKETS